MSTDELLKAKLYRLDELRKYQSYYGPNTPYPVIVEINDLEAEIRQLMQVQGTRRTRLAKKKKKKASPWRMSQATFDLIATIAFIGLVFLLGSIVFAAYVQTRPGDAVAVVASAGEMPVVPTLRPTFTPTSASNPAPVIMIDDPNLPPAAQEPTPIPTPVATLTPSATPRPTEPPLPTATPAPTDTPLPTNPPPPQPPQAAEASVTVATPAPSFPFMVAEQGNRAFQKTTYHAITIYVAVVSEGNIPLGGYKVVGDHVPSGAHAESAPSDWNWSVTNCLDCDYIKQGNLKFEPGPFTDGVWNIYLTDSSGAPLSPVVTLPYSTNPDEWVWDFIIFRRISG